MMEGLKSRTYKEGYGRVRVVVGGHDQKPQRLTAAK